MNKLQSKICVTKALVEIEQKKISRSVDLIRSYSEKADVYKLVTFLPSEIKNLSERMKRLAELTETLNLLEYLEEE